MPSQHSHCALASSKATRFPLPIQSKTVSITMAKKYAAVLHVCLGVIRTLTYAKSTNFVFLALEWMMTPPLRTVVETKTAFEKSLADSCFSEGSFQVAAYEV